MWDQPRPKRGTFQLSQVRADMRLDDFLGETNGRGVFCVLVHGM